MVYPVKRLSRWYSALFCAGLLCAGSGAAQPFFEDATATVEFLPFRSGDIVFGHFAGRIGHQSQLGANVRFGNGAAGD